MAATVANRFYNTSAIRRRQEKYIQLVFLTEREVQAEISTEKLFYNPPAIRRRQDKKFRLIFLTEIPNEKDAENREEKQEEKFLKFKTAEEEKQVLTEREADATNLDRFLKSTTPKVTAQYLAKKSTRGWRAEDIESYPYFVLESLWNSFEGWSAYGAGVPLLLNEIESVVQYYAPYLSGMQLYIDSSEPYKKLRPSQASDTESSRQTSSNGSSDSARNGVSKTWVRKNSVDANRLPSMNRTFKDSSSDECSSSTLPSQLIFEYFERDDPSNRQPLFNKVTSLASQFPELKTYRSCDLAPSSWISVAWYPIYRIPAGPKLQNLDACFLTFHSLSTSSQGMYKNPTCARAILSKLSLTTFGLAAYKFRVGFWNPSNGEGENQKANSLLRAADNWLKLLKVYHPDYSFFVSHNSYS